ncbi:mechanosensitive ion channel family protein [cf. Phormidesmis sp. LEGE 11477]|uniref:mechanosensitive ion channel family protein n=1 Tax=cf. Phormidesmis sp. LEGE 11477 TaxID=1828680 RepID=UPI00187DFD4C|nr:mechanosensitive ion channel domain-containing protein [cf. Phormidesmis sp. LEGE 11477]MBE9064299.1 mechanosensitive ion channel [cf. Phormidesmis sp. LEGE 11477]
MDTLLSALKEIFQIDRDAQLLLTRLAIQLGLFVFFVLLSAAIGQGTPALIRLFFHKAAPDKVANGYDALIKPLQPLLRVTGTLILISLSLSLLQEYQGLYEFLSFFVTLATVISVAWLSSRLFRQFVRVYGIDLMRRANLEVDEMLLVVETLINVAIGVVAVIAFAQNQGVSLVGLIAGFGIGGAAIAFAAQKTLEQLIGTVVLYLDRPFVPGDHIRVSLNPHADDVYGRIESIGLRSTKLRSAAKNTLVIIPNSTMANLDIENITRGKKVMVLLYLDFVRVLDEREQALVQQVVKESTDTLFGIDPGSTKISLFKLDDRSGSRARVTFFILGSSENSIQLRKRLLELANAKISAKLLEYNIQFTVEDPTVYVDSPVTI